MDGIVLLQAECKILLLFGLGMLLKKLQLTNAEADQFLSDLLMNVLMPMNIFVSFYQSMSLEELSTCGWLVPAGALVMAVVMLCARLIPAEDHGVLYAHLEWLDGGHPAGGVDVRTHGRVLR